MNHTWNVNIWGVRGSFPVPDTDFLKYGGNTSCISVDYGDGVVIFDAGSGLLKLGRRLKERGIRQVHILISHLHMDHCLGLPGFPLFQDPCARIHLYGSPHHGMGFRTALETLLGPPYWPLGLNDFSAYVEIHELLPGDSFGLAEPEGSSDGIRVHTLAGNHPNQSLLYRMEHKDKSVIYALDCEMDEGMAQALTAFSKGAGLLIWDASFSDQELPLRRGWGHSSWKEGIVLRQRAGADAVLMTHFSSGYTDSFLAEQERLCALADPASRFAREGMELSLPPHRKKEEEVAI